MLETLILLKSPWNDRLFAVQSRVAFVRLTKNTSTSLGKLSIVTARRPDFVRELSNPVEL